MARRILRSMFAHGPASTIRSAEGQPIDFAAHAEVTRADAEEAIVLLKNATGSCRCRRACAGSPSSAAMPTRACWPAAARRTSIRAAASRARPASRRSWPGPIMYLSVLADGRDPAAGARRHGPLRSTATIRPRRRRWPRDSDVVIVFATQWDGESFDVPLHPAERAGRPDRRRRRGQSEDRRRAGNRRAGADAVGGQGRRPARGLVSRHRGRRGDRRVLFGEVNPSGHLPATFPRSADQLPHPAAPQPGRHDLYGRRGGRLQMVRCEAASSRNSPSATVFPTPISRMSGLKRGAGRRARSRSPSMSAIPANARARRCRKSMSAAAGWEAPKRLAGWDKVTPRPGRDADGDDRRRPAPAGDLGRGQPKLAHRPRHLSGDARRLGPRHSPDGDGASRGRDLAGRMASLKCCSPPPSP